jgi:molybdopterin/thiamine biosynthesis adenylyltransferase/rhodanese-related sulfurtransferase
MYDALLRDLRATIPEVDPAAARASGGVLIDVREPDELASGAVAGALRIPRGLLESRVEAAVADRAALVIVYCASGARSLFAARSLRELGYTNVRSMAGGFTAWKRAGLPWETPVVLRPDQEARYARHTRIPEVGVEGQGALLRAKVALVGAGGLGSPAAMYLAAAGVGTLTIIDDDTVDASNLQRQILHGTDRVGVAKVDSAERTLSRLNPDVHVVKKPVRLAHDNVDELLAGHDVVIDGSDNFPTRYLVNDAAVKLGVPVVHASVYRFEGRISVFRGAPCYRCLYPEAPAAGDAPSCAEAGVLGVLPGVIGTLQATEAIKLILGVGDPLVGRILLYDALAASFREVKLRADPKCRACGIVKP